MGLVRSTCAGVAVISFGLAACGSSDDGADDAIESVDSVLVPGTLGQLDGVVVTVSPDDLAGEVVRIDETGAISTGGAPGTTAVVSEIEGVEPQEVAPEVNPLGGDDPEDNLMPDVMCMGLQDAQDEIQDHGVFFSKSEDATGEGRRQLWDRNWIVVAQSPAAGEPIGEGEAVLSVVKKDESNDC